MFYNVLFNLHIYLVIAYTYLHHTVRVSKWGWLGFRREHNRNTVAERSVWRKHHELQATGLE